MGWPTKMGYGHIISSGHFYREDEVPNHGMTWGNTHLNNFLVLPHARPIDGEFYPPTNILDHDGSYPLVNEHNYGKSSFYSWVNPLFQWPFSIAILT